jgi:hypothetical protein
MGIIAGSKPVGGYHPIIFATQKPGMDITEYGKSKSQPIVFSPWPNTNACMPTWTATDKTAAIVAPPIIAFE